MTRMMALGFVALAAAFLINAPQARADDSDGGSIQTMAEMTRAEAVRHNAPGWSNGEARLVASGTGYGVAYSGKPRGDVGREGATMIGNSGDGPIVAYKEPAMPSMMAAR
ncbi:hypothetical protein [Paracraurococcus lichenis]|uniref:Uncharacterized protein n=1 Tax=Paracraurococcus lichenis TaxID=3064888 RepID=A0ABT9ECB3_9PROT|nr:hypothetical protein [Paracraurococcus sp. LOR1-02]MDO9713856.1 hypothetical protein [Paracraurococcus sp. LOR1-02]